MVANFAGSKIKLNQVDSPVLVQKDNKELEKKHPSLTLPYLLTPQGDVISSTSGIMSYIGKSSDAKLWGTSVF